MSRISSTAHKKVLNLLDNNKGTFSRALAAYGQIGAFTDGTTRFLRVFGANERRVENRADGNGVCFLMEPSRTNKWLYNRSFFGTSPGSSEVVTSNACASPDGLTAGTEDNVAFGNYGSYQVMIYPANTQIVGTSYQRRVTGTGNGKPGLSNGDVSSAASVATALTTTYQRLELQVNMLVRTDLLYIPEDGRSTWGGTDQALDAACDLVQVEAGYWPTSPIDTLGTPVTRPQDLLSYSSTEYPKEFLSTGFVFEFAPDCSSTEFLAEGGSWVFLSVGAGLTDAVILYNDGGTAALALVCATNELATIEPLTWSRGQKLTVTVRPASGFIKLEGATTGNTTIIGVGASAWASGQTLYVGNKSDGSQPVSGRWVGGKIRQY